MISGIGAILAYGGTTAPAGTLLCDGSSVSQATYSGLFAVIGTRFGAGDGPMTFNLPNLTGTATYIIVYVDDTTGSGPTVLSHGPVLGNPTLGAAHATSLAFSSTSGLIGTTTNNNAAAGSVGEYVVSRVTTASPVSLTSSTAANVTSISLTAGDWDVCGQVAFETGSTTSIARLEGALTRTSGTRPDAWDDTQSLTLLAWEASSPGTATLVLPCVPARMSLAATTTVYLLAYAVFTVSTLDAYGFISARRIR